MILKDPMENNLSYNPSIDLNSNIIDLAEARRRRDTVKYLRLAIEPGNTYFVRRTTFDSVAVTTLGIVSEDVYVVTSTKSDLVDRSTGETTIAYSKGDAMATHNRHLKEYADDYDLEILDSLEEVPEDI